MKIAGIIAEYNPFHNGHAYHIQQTRLLTGCTHVIAVMTGHITQRGAFACLDKWNRTRAALSCGADAVFELPALFAARTADIFATGGISILTGLGADFVSFGCEKEGVPYLQQLAQLSMNEPESVRLSIRQKLNSGCTHAKARGEAYAEYLNIAADVLDRPNFALALEYNKALMRMNARTQAIAIERTGNYHSQQLGGMASASAIRAAIAAGNDAEAKNYVPENTLNLISNACNAHAPDDILLYRLRQMSAEEIAALPDAPEGIEMRIKRAADKCSTAEELTEQVKCRRYTRARIGRLLAHALIDLNGDLALSHPRPEYARLLGMRQDAAPLLKELSKRASIPIVSDPVSLKENEIFRLECRVTDTWALCRNLPEERTAGQEFTHKFVRV